MAALDTAHDIVGSDGWAWWQARRLRYNLTLAVGGWVAYGLAVVLNYAFGHRVWQDWRGGLGMTIFLGAAYLAVMGVANVCYLLGPAVEAWIRPPDVVAYRRTAYAMGLWGSLVAPALFPLMQLAMLVGHAHGAA
jgi:hypothetical protein